MKKLHLDTDIGGDIDDLCALAMLLKRKDVEITGITTVAEDGGKRAGFVRYTLDLAGRRDIPVAAGADVSGGYYKERPVLAPEGRYWPAPVPPAPGPIERAFDLLEASVEQGAMVVAIGPYTNLRLFDEARPGLLSRSEIWLMGGYVYPPRAGFPPWGNEMDYNVQIDVRSAHYVLERLNVTLVPLTVTVETALRRAHLPALRASGPLGQLISRQAEAFAAEFRFESVYGAMCAGLPRDLINFQHDPLACAIALGWDEGVEIQQVPLKLEEGEGLLVERVDPQGKPTRVVTRVNGAAFSEYWLGQVADG